MSKISFENFGHVAEKTKDNTIVASRYLVQKEGEKLIVPELKNKLELKPHDTVLDIGSGTGNLTIPISFLVEEITALDHEKCLDALRKRTPEAENINYLPGNFLDIEIRQSFKKIFCYGVLHYLSNIDQVLFAVNKAAGLLENNGILLLGDIPNADNLKRFISNPKGRKEYNLFLKKLPSNATDKNSIKFYLQDRKLDSNCLEFNDTVVEKIKSTMISNGYSVNVVRQDIIIKNTNN